MQSGFHRQVVAGVLAGLLLAGVPSLSRAGDEAADDLAALRRTSQAFTRAARQVTPAVVFITVEKVVQAQRQPGPGMQQFNDPFGFFGEDFFERFFGGRPGQGQGGRGPARQFRQVGQGSGFIITRDGYILTNNHVVGDADKITVKLKDGREFEGTLVGTDPKSEVAVIKIEAGEELPVAELGDASSLEIGEWVMAVGNPFGLAETVTVGVVSATGRNNIGIAEYEDFIQTDAAINPGNSGGPLVNLDGQVVGINTAIYTRSGGYMGIGFAIPVNLAVQIKDQLVANGRVVRGYLGIQLNREELSDDMAQSFGLDQAGGVLVAEVVDGSPAAAAGLQAGDIILEMDGEPVAGNSTFRNRVAMVEPGRTVALLIFRDGTRRTVDVTIGTLPGEEGGPEATAAVSKLGLSVRDLTEDVAQRMGYEADSGVLVDGVEPGSPAEAADLRPGCLVTSVNRRPVQSVADFNRALADAAPVGRVLLRVKCQQVSWYVLLRLP